MTGATIDISLDGQLGLFRLNFDAALPMYGISALFGPSGCGKTSVLRAVAGLNRIPGCIVVGGEVWQDEQTFVPTHRRALGYVFQEASLFPHLSVRRNLTYGEARTKGVPRHTQFDEIVELLGIGHLVDRMPDNLSGGERQRVAIGRALLAQPRLLLMDEPLSALDRMAKDEVLPYFEALHANLKIPIILVTHDISEVERLADHVVLMRDGRVLASGPLSAMQADPSLPLAAGRQAAVTLDAVLDQYDSDYGLATLKVSGGEFLVPMEQAARGSHQRLTIAAGDVSLATQAPQGSTLLNSLPARVLSATIAGNEVIAVLGLGDDGAGSRILSRVTRKSWESLGFREGQLVHAQAKSVALVRRKSR